ncbi:hypothetical protein V8G54_034690 [Vigna mungo]|uniref:Uncharacterized protein n=1 Tax=Vigna mungo TaxID=3915 RepID=A0AAQ3MDK0_VIGMU
MQGVEDVKTQSMGPYTSSSSRNINIHASRTTTIYDQGLKFGYRNFLSPPSQMHPIKNFVQDSKTESMGGYGLSFNSTTNASLMASSAYGKMWGLGFPSHSNKRLTLNDIGLQGEKSGFSSHIHGATSLYHQRNNNPLMLNHSNPNRVYTNTIIHGMKDLSRERAMKRPLCEFEDIDTIASVSKRSKGKQLQELLLFKDDEHPLSTLKNEKDNTDKKNLDLSLCI